MAQDLTKYYQALEQADRAGDTQGAQEIANFIKSQQVSVAPAPAAAPQQPSDVYADNVADPNNPFSYVPESQKTEQGRVGKAISRGVQNTMRVGAGLAQGGVIDPLIAGAQMLPGETASNFVRGADENYQKFRQGMGGEGFDASRLAGNVISPVGIKGAQLAKQGLLKYSPNAGRVAQGSVMAIPGAASQPIIGESGIAEDKATPYDKFVQTATGAAVGGALNKALQPIEKGVNYLGTKVANAGGLNTTQANLMAESLRKNPIMDVDLNTLSNREKVQLFRQLHPNARLTWGQRAGEAVNNLEQIAESIPGVGGALRKSRQEGIESWDNSLIQRVAKSGDVQLSPGVRAETAFAELQKKLGAKYDEVLEGTQLNDPAKLRRTIIGSLDDKGNYIKGKVSDDWNQLSPAGQKEVDSLLERYVFQKFGKDPSGQHSVRLTGKQFKDAEESLKEKISELANGTGGEQTMARVLRKTLDEMYDSLEGGAGTSVKQLNKAYQQMKTLEKASTSRGTNVGMFNPTQLINIAKQGSGRSLVAQGRSELGKEAKLAQEVFGLEKPNAWTADRLLTLTALPALTGGGGFLYSGGDPLTGVASGVGGAAALYGGLYGATRGIYSPITQKAIDRGLGGLKQRFSNSRAGALLEENADTLSPLAARYATTPEYEERKLMSEELRKREKEK